MHDEKEILMATQSALDTSTRETHSLIGSDTEVKGESRSLNIGDNTEIDLGES